jgi:anti-sigma regulatory factor (Ser/Thr protein kinase)
MVDYRLALVPDVSDIPRLIDWVEACCREAAVSGDFTCKLVLAIEEAAANVIHHAFDGIPAPHRIEVKLAITAERIRAELIDNGGAFDPSLVPETDTSLPLERREPGGLGVRLIRRMMDHVDYQRIAGENRLILEKTRL